MNGYENKITRQLITISDKNRQTDYGRTSRYPLYSPQFFPIYRHQVGISADIPCSVPCFSRFIGIKWGFDGNKVRAVSDHLNITNDWGFRRMIPSSILPSPTDQRTRRPEDSDPEDNSPEESSRADNSSEDGFTAIKRSLRR